MSLRLFINYQFFDQLYRWILHSHKDLNNNKWITALFLDTSFHSVIYFRSKIKRYLPILSRINN